MTDHVEGKVPQNPAASDAQASTADQMAAAMAALSPEQLMAMMMQKCVAEGHETYDHFMETLDHPREVNERLLFELIESARDGEFGRAHHFDEIKTIEDFKRLVPTTIYDDYAGQVFHAMETGDCSLLGGEPIVHFAETSGTMGNPKGIPYTQRAAAHFNRFGSNYLFGLISHELGAEAMDGARLSLTECKLSTLKGGITYGAFSSKVISGFRDFLPLMMTSPVEATFPELGTDTRYLHARFALVHADIVELAAGFISTLLDLMRYIEDNWEMLVADIGAGTIDESVRMPDEVRASVQAKCVADPERAAALREQFERGFDHPIVKRIWPRVAVITSISGAGFAPYTERLRRYIGFDIPLYYFGYIASEGMFSVPVKLDDPTSVLIPEASYFEFLPLGETDYSQTIGIEDVQPGCEYEVVISNLSGFFRYKMRDAIRVVGTYKKTPIIEFLCRIDQTVNMKGEKTTERVLSRVADNVAARCGFELVDYSVYPNLDHQPPRYEFLFELFHPDAAALDLDAIDKVADEELRVGNADMQDMREWGDFAPTKAFVLQEQTSQLWRDMRVAKGASPNQIKPVHIIDTPMKRNFFYMLIDRELDGRAAEGEQE